MERDRRKGRGQMERETIDTMSCLPLKWFTVLFYVFVNKTMKTRISDLNVLLSIIRYLSRNVTNIML